nr:replication initiation protein [Microvirus sp.]
MYHKSSYFVTLTYADEYVPIHYYSDPETGLALPSMSLQKRDYQLFMKRLRKKFGDGIRFYASGEYGSESFRPHYHAIIFGLELNDLTYADEYVPIHYYSDPETGLALPSMSLQKRDYQLFMKRLRKKFGDGIRFYASGEYGSESFRPHYHAIIFGLELNDLRFYKNSPQGFKYFNSSSLSDVWPYGFAVAASVTWETCAYTARYVMKKLSGPEASFYEYFNIEPEFSLMSRKPGIARQYYEDHPDLYEHEFINISTEKGGRKFRPPKYYDKLFDLDCPEESAKLKAIRSKMADEAKKAKLQKTTLSYLDQLAVEERDHPDLYEHEFINISTEKGGRKFRPPKYYDKLFDLDCPEESAKLKAIRSKMADEAKKAKLQKTTLSYLDQLAVEERNQLARIKSLKRSCI